MLSIWRSGCFDLSYLSSYLEPNGRSRGVEGPVLIREMIVSVSPRLSGIVHLPDFLPSVLWSCPSTIGSPTPFADRRTKKPTIAQSAGVQIIEFSAGMTSERELRSLGE